MASFFCLICKSNLLININLFWFDILSRHPAPQKRERGMSSVSNVSCPVRIGWRMKVDIVGSMPIWFMHNFPIKKEKNFGEVEYG